MPSKIQICKWVNVIQYHKKDQETRQSQHALEQIVKRQEWRNDVKPNDNTRYYYLGSKALSNSKIQKVTIDGQELECVRSIKLVGVYIQSDLKWNTHVNYVVSGTKPLYVQ